MNTIHRRTRTLERGIEWLPRHDSHYILARMMVSARLAPPLCILQSTLRELDERIQGAHDFSFGLLSGSLCTCRQSQRDYTLIDGFVECALPAEEGDVYGLIARTLREQVVLLERTGTSAVGFYLSHTSVLPRAAREDVALFRAVFEQPWNVMLLRDRTPEGDLGAFIRVESVDEQPYAAPFIELVPAVGRRQRKDVMQTVVRWTNYQPTEVVRDYEGDHSPGNAVVVRDNGAGSSKPGLVGRVMGRLSAPKALLSGAGDGVERSRSEDPMFTSVVRRPKAGNGNGADHARNGEGHPRVAARSEVTDERVLAESGVEAPAPVESEVAGAALAESGRTRAALAESVIVPPAPEAKEPPAHVKRQPVAPAEVQNESAAPPSGESVVALPHEVGQEVAELREGLRQVEQEIATLHQLEQEVTALRQAGRTADAGARAEESRSAAEGGASAERVAQEEASAGEKSFTAEAVVAPPDSYTPEERSISKVEGHAPADASAMSKGRMPDAKVDSTRAPVSPRPNDGRRSVAIREAPAADVVSSTPQPASGATTSVDTSSRVAERSGAQTPDAPFELIILPPRNASTDGTRRVRFDTLFARWRRWRRS